jgi:hypothetical protein
MTMGLTQLIGAIKLRVQEQGGVITRPDAIGKAEAVKREADYLADRDRLMRDAVWIGELQRSIREAMAELVRLASEIKASQRLDLMVAPGSHGLTIIPQRICQHGGWLAAADRELCWRQRSI